MGVESPINFISPGGNIEHPKTLREYYTTLKGLIDKRNKTIREKPDTGNMIGYTIKLDDEAGRLDAFVELEGHEVLDQPIGVAIDKFEQFIRDNNAEYQKKFGGKNVKTLSLDEQAEAGDLIRAVDILEKIVGRMTQFEQGQR